MPSTQHLGILVTNINRDLAIIIPPAIYCISAVYFLHYTMIYIFNISSVHYIARDALRIRYFCPHFIDILVPQRC